MRLFPTLHLLQP
ncbi:hypothetical protein E2C01_073481 [Portunus trituberculatus]|uniref:Uncharacterized protein n=1 Tax=Portunus trituberculatus TaxID=210409 RepID=A0A5B7I0S6_PORTR|nr:hypothetical protein [Portunus trituberculatus]